jgi:hypothetical protein
MEGWHQKVSETGELCHSCEHRREDGFWFYRLDDGWVGYDSREHNGKVGGGLFVCVDCALYECEVYWSIPPGLWSPDVNDIDGQEPRLSRILRQHAGLPKRVEPELIKPVDAAGFYDQVVLELGYCPRWLRRRNGGPGEDHE